MEQELLQKYMQKRLSRQDEQKLIHLRKVSTQISLLVDLVDACTAIKVHQKSKTPMSLSDDQLELLMIRLLSFKIQPKDASLFLTGLDHPLFYQKILNILDIAATPDSNFADEVPEIRVQTTEDIVNRLFYDSQKSKSLWASLLDFVEKIVPVPIATWQKAAGLGTALATIVIALFLILPSGPSVNPLYAKYFSDSQTPILLQRSKLSELTAPRQRSKNDSVERIDSLILNYQVAFSDYMNGDYQQSLQMFNKIEPSLMHLDESEKNAYLVSEFRFYVGLCHLNLVGSEKNNQLHLEEAIRNLSESLEIAQKYEFQHVRQVPFFLALAHEMSGDADAADLLLQKFPVAKQYSQDAALLRTGN